MTHAIMSNTDYKGICDTVRAKTGTTALLKSAEVAPAIRSIELSTTSLTLTVTTEAGATVTATKGSLSVSAVATNGTAVLKLKEAGEWTVTASLGGETSAVLVSVTDSYELTLKYFPAIGTPLNDMSWADIATVAKMGLAEQYFKVGDRKAVMLNGTVGSITLSNYATYCYIIGINHNAELEGQNLIHFQLAKTALSGGVDIAFKGASVGSTTSSATAFVMQTSSTNSGGWEDSHMRKNICGTDLSNTGNTVLAALPADLKEVLAPVVKYTNNSGGYNIKTSDITATTDYVFLLAECEIYGKAGYASSHEAAKQSQYAYYAAGNSKVKYGHSATSTAVYHWVRSPENNTNYTYVVVDTIGSGRTQRANTMYSFAPAFCVGGV